MLMFSQGTAQSSAGPSDAFDLTGLGVILEGAEQSGSEDTDNIETIKSSSSDVSTEIRCVACQAIEEVSHLSPCAHCLCVRCICTLLVGTERTPNQHIVCPYCKRVIEKLTPPLTNRSEEASWYHILKPQPGTEMPISRRPGGESLRRSISSSSVHSGVVRITNFPATLRATELEALVEPLVGEVSVHILQDRHPQDGRTISPAFIEVLGGSEAAHVAVEALQGKMFNDHILCSEMSSQEEMLEYMFPSWEAGFTGSQPFFLFEGKPFEGNFLREDEIHNMLELCKLESIYAVLAPERPFLNIVSVITKLPWRQPYLYSTTFATSLMSTALGALNILFVSAKDRIPDYLDVATKLVQSIYDCPAASASDVMSVSQLVDCYWPRDLPTSVRVPTEPYMTPEPSPKPSPPTDHPPESPECDSQVDTSITLTPSHSNRASFDSLRAAYSPPSINTERSYARRRPGSIDPYAAIALELGVDEDLVRAIARRLR